MRYLLLTLRNYLRKNDKGRIGNEDGSIIFIAVLLLMLMSIIAVSASQTSLIESGIIRNIQIHTQNISLVETAALEIAQDALINIEEPANVHLAASNNPQREDYIISRTQWEASGLNDHWYDVGATGSGRILSGDGTSFPEWIEPTFVPEMTLIDDRRNEANAPLRVALIGWESAPNSSLKATAASRKRGKIVAEYVSPNNGMSRLEIGIEREF